MFWFGPIVAPPNATLTATPTVATLDGYLGKNIKEICGNKFHDNSANHCAHFVSHVMNFSFGYTCKAHKGGDETGANVRVHETFAQCPEVAEWDDANPKTSGLAFVTDKDNVNLAKKTMSNVPKKHIGTLLDGCVWHYSNTRDKVVKVTVAEFKKHYAGKDIRVFWGKFPQS
jgi:hypothetical protein